ncbi:SNF2 family N-terminal domain-containing protein [Cristinia sonorae]|uniref:Chromatin-remodeling ATPase INO80 n=1 Tax=Cristinia sonorae TaxID=1940300 RepID=A0A8K0UNF2_9AGAR|nr:SNF2 family N-terminal domain-containing protein [Cristinia sonorae]
MSLRRILNDQPSPPLPGPPLQQSAHPHLPPADTTPPFRSPSPASSSSVHNGYLRQRGRSRSPPMEPETHHPRPVHHPPGAYPGPAGWDHHNGQRAHGDMYLTPGGGNSYYSDRDGGTPPTPPMTNGGTLKFKDRYAETNGSGRKRKAPMSVDEEEEYTTPGSTRRRGTRRNPQRRGGLPQALAPNDDPQPDAEDEPYELTEEERRLASSDLEDCPELWKGELGNYIMETHRRQRQIESYFGHWIIGRDAQTASTLSHNYVGRISRIPPPPLPPVLHLPIDDDAGSVMRAPSPSAMSVDGMDMGTHEFIAEDMGQYTAASAGANEDAARELEESLLGPISKSRSRGKGKAVETNKRSASRVGSAASSEEDIPISRTAAPPKKRRRVAKDKAVDIADEVERSLAMDFPSSASTPALPAAVKNLASGRGRGKQREQSVDSTVASASATPRQRKRAPLKKKADALPPQTQEALGIGSAAPSVVGDATPVGSRPPSPTLTNVSATVYELDEVIPPLRKAKKMDDAIMAKRVRMLEEAQKKVWTNIARRDIVKVYRFHSTSYQVKVQQDKRLATMAAVQARRPYVKSAKAAKDVQSKGKRLMREMLVFWKKNEKEEREVRRREHKEAMDRAKIEEEKREAARQARKLEFLISQTELYSHFVGNKLKTAEVEGEAAPTAPVGAGVDDVEPDKLLEIDFDDEDETNMQRHARRNAQEAIALAKRKAQDFDTQAALERKTNEAIMLAKQQAHVRDEHVEGMGPSGTPLVDLDSDELNFQNPTSLSGELTIKQPKMLMATLKEYQLKGLNWLGTLYEQGINGILADEMGLGKTVQSISLLAYLAEAHDIWGPFLVVSPASTLHNWQQEITRFVPKLKALPYWGNVKDRATLRKFWSKKEISYNEDAPFHVLITSYQLVTQDQQYFQRVKWQYMILDEAQNIKNSSSARWKTLLGFHCRNRLLLTGTPIQNSMQELWALLHFIMPSLFDSHDEFNEWFSKDIENAAENKGSKLNEHQLRRLHMILKPFMLRRVKRHVQNELSDKIEIDIYVDLSARQRALYKALLANVSVADLLEKAANIGDAESARSLMNLVMQFRKVCNHPELFERADVVASFSFSEFGKSGPLNREGDLVQLPYSTRNPIEIRVPKLLYLDGGLLDVPHENSSLSIQTSPLNKFNIWSTDWIQRSMYDDDHPSFSFLRFLDMSPSEAHTIHTTPLLRRKIISLHEEAERLETDPYLLDSDFMSLSTANRSRRTVLKSLRNLETAENLPALHEISTLAWHTTCLSRAGFKWFVPPAVAPPIAVHCSDRTFVDKQAQMIESPSESLILYGLPPATRESPVAIDAYKQSSPEAPITGLVSVSDVDQLPLSTMQVPEAKRLIYDSAKLARLDSLLQELKAGDHRVLVYFQMTRMMDLMEEYLIFRQYKYLRLDGSSKLEDRRDMVMEWQTRPDIFIFLLSTRAGGLGINLTAADTVVFYDHDWNPSNDAQAMDRAHRLGQTRQVTVYRLITKGTIDERIVQLARVKKDVQDIVVGNKNFTDVTKPSEIVQLLLNEDQLANLDNTASASTSKKAGKRAAQGDSAESGVRDLWNDEGDEFFGHSVAAQNGSVALGEGGDEEESQVPTPTAGRGRKRKGEPGTSTRGRKAGGGRGGRKKAQAAAVDGES